MFGLTGERPGNRASEGTTAAQGCSKPPDARGRGLGVWGTLGAIIRSVARWADFEADAGRLAQVAHERLITPGVLLVATTRRDGTARLSPVEPLIADGDLWLSMMWQSRKAADLARDNRILLHSIVIDPREPQPEIKLRGRAVPFTDPGHRRRYCEAVSVLGWQPEEPHFHLFKIDIDDVTYIRYDPSGDQHVASWPARIEFLRRMTSPTSVGTPEPSSELFDPGAKR
jgi:hypothetical protein